MKAEDVFREIQERRRRGEAPDVDDYCRRYPRLSEAIQWLESLDAAGEELPHDEPRRDPIAETKTPVPSRSPADRSFERAWKRLDSVALRPGDTVAGHYKLIKELGRGGFGRVFLAEQTIAVDDGSAAEEPEGSEPPTRRVALKFLRFGTEEKEIVGRFKLECQTLAMLDHPHIARLFDAGATQTGQPFYVMEYIAGESVTSYSDRHRLAIRGRLDLFLVVCRAIQYAHQRGVIHRDLKPQNVLVAEAEDGAPIVKVIDFGLAKSLNRAPAAESLHTQTGQVIGTPAYMSPEQASGDPAKIDVRTDVYSLGVLLYQLLAGVVPLKDRLGGASFAEIQRVICEVDPRSPSSAAGRGGEEVAAQRQVGVATLKRILRGELDAIVLKALEKRRDHRYQSVDELATDVENHLACRPVLARSPGAFYRARKFIQRHRVGSGWVAAGLLALLLAWLASAILEQHSFQNRVVEAENAIAADDLTTARAKWSALREEHRDRVEVDRVGKRLVQAMYNRGAAAWQNGLRSESTAKSRLEEWKGERERGDSSRPVWYREEERALWARYDEERQRVAELYDAALRELHSALIVVPDGWEERGRIRELLERIYLHRYDSTRRGSSVDDSLSYFRTMMDTHGAGKYRALLEGGTIHIESDPAGAEIYVFRYEEHEARLLPLAYDPGAREVVGQPFLKVERRRESSDCPFLPGDRFLRVRDVEVRSRGDVVAALAGIESGATVPVDVDRKGRSVRVDWIPFPREELTAEDGSAERKPALQVFSFLDQFQFNFEGYPLEFSPRNRLVENTGRAASLQLPKGSYLFVLKKDGFVDVRLPMVVPVERTSEEGPVARQQRARVHLLRKPEIPDGFVYVPAGTVATGGDPDAFGSLEWGVRPVPAFFMSRFEVTTDDWEEFVNHPDVASQIEPDGRIPPRSPAVTEFLRQSPRLIQVIPTVNNKLVFSRLADRWVVNASLRGKPVVSISQLAAEEYAHWRNERAGADGEPWRFRLPTDLEWERAASGDDRRHFVWGNYLVWSFCRSHWGRSPDTPRLSEPGAVPFDESVFGVRDLNGSVSEHTTGRPLPRRPANSVYRGGSFNHLDEGYFRLRARNTMTSWDRYVHFGVRLVAERAP